MQVAHMLAGHMGLRDLQLGVGQHEEAVGVGKQECCTWLRGKGLKKLALPKLEGSGFEGCEVHDELVAMGPDRTELGHFDQTAALAEAAAAMHSACHGQNAGVYQVGASRDMGFVVGMLCFHGLLHCFYAHAPHGCGG